MKGQGFECKSSPGRGERAVAPGTARERRCPGSCRDRIQAGATRACGRRETRRTRASARGVTAAGSPISCGHHAFHESDRHQNLAVRLFAHGSAAPSGLTSLNTIPRAHALGYSYDAPPALRFLIADTFLGVRTRVRAMPHLSEREPPRTAGGQVSEGSSAAGHAGRNPKSDDRPIHDNFRLADHCRAIPSRPDHDLEIHTNG
jgi:hypothetical protein